MIEIDKLIKENFGEEVWINYLSKYFDQELDKIF